MHDSRLGVVRMFSLIAGQLGQCLISQQARALPLMCLSLKQLTTSSVIDHELLCSDVNHTSSQKRQPVTQSAASSRSTQQQEPITFLIQRAELRQPVCLSVLQQRTFGTDARSLQPELTYAVGLHNLRDNPGAKKKRIRVGRGDSARRGNYSGRGMKGQKARGKAHILYDGGQLGLLKFPITREKPPYEVLYNQLGLSRVIAYIQLGLLDPSKVITMKDLQDCGCVKFIKYGVMLYGKETTRLGFQLHIQVTACTDTARQAVEAAGGSVTRVYYATEGLRGLLQPETYTAKGLPLPLPATRWHPKHDGKFDAIGQLPPNTDIHPIVSASAVPLATALPTTQQAAASIVAP